MHPRIKLVRVFSRLNVGGPSIHVILLTAGLNPARFASTLLVGREGSREGDMRYLAELHKVVPVVVPFLGRDISIWNDIRSTLALWRFMRRERPGIVHTHTSKAGFSGRIAAFLAGVPVVVHTFHGHVFHGYFGTVKTALFVLLERWLAWRSDAIVTVSERLKQDLVRRRIAPAEKIRVIELGLDLRLFSPGQGRSGELRSEFKIPAGNLLAGIVGRLVPIKDHRTFLQAASIVCRDKPNIEFAVVGDGELRTQLECQARGLGLQNRVHFTGWRRDLPAVYSDLDFVVLSSRNEGTPVSLIEASAAGKPVVATRVGGVPDFIVDNWNGLLVDPGDATALAAAMLRIIEDPASAAERAARSREMVRDRFSATRLFQDIDRLYSGLMAQKGFLLQEVSRSADGIAI
jgi:glycosyltransferase involved in cell wall biosynthesis